MHCCCKKDKYIDFHMNIFILLNVYTRNAFCCVLHIYLFFFGLRCKHNRTKLCHNELQFVTKTQISTTSNTEWRFPIFQGPKKRYLKIIELASVMVYVWCCFRTLSPKISRNFSLHKNLLHPVIPWKHIFRLDRFDKFPSIFL